MIWFAQWENKSQPYITLREALAAWGLSKSFGKRIESGVYMINAYGGDVHFIRQDKLQKWSTFIEVQQ